MANVLIIDDEITVCTILSEMVRRLGHCADFELSLHNGLRAAQLKRYDVVFLDVNLPDGNGIDIVQKIRDTEASPEVVIMTGYGCPDGAERAVKNGAWDYIQKPITPKKILLPLNCILQYCDNLRKTQKPSVALKLDGIVGSSKKMKACFDFVAQASRSEANVLITGETGTGKELFAKAIHANSPRADKGMVVVDCAALPESIIESVLFGHEKGAFTSADRAREGLIKHADGGTLFLDEVGELPQSQQKAFLRVLQDHRFRPIGGKEEIESNFRLVAATNRNLDEMVGKGQFRKDLLYRLRAMEIHLPPLRERPEDLIELLMYYSNKLCEEYDVAPKDLSPECIEAFAVYDWPGNVRELINILTMLLATTREESTFFIKHLPVHMRVMAARASFNEEVPIAVNLEEDYDPSFKFPQFKDYKEDLILQGEKEYLLELISFTKGSIKDACQLSGLGRTWIYTLLKKYGISRFGWSASN